MAGEQSNTENRLRGNLLSIERDICSGETGPRGLTYDESSVMYSLLWNQPSMYPAQRTYSLRYANAVVRKGAAPRLRSAALGLPLFYSDSPNDNWGDGEGEGGEGAGGQGEEEGADKLESVAEIHEEALSVVERVPPWSLQDRRTVDYVAPPSREGDTLTRVRSTVGYEFPPVMSKMIEANVQRMWQKWKERGLVPADHPTEERRLYNQLVVDTHVFMVREVERRLLLEDVVSSDSEVGEECSRSGPTQRVHEQPVLLSPGEFYSSTASSSDEETAKSRRNKANRKKKKKKKKKKRPWNQQLPLTQEYVQHCNSMARARRRRKRNRSETLSSEEEWESDKERDEDSSGGRAARGSGRSWSSGGQMKRERSSSEEEGEGEEEEGSEGSNAEELGEGGRSDKGVRGEEHTPNKARSITLLSRKLVLSTVQGVRDGAESDSTSSSREEEEDEDWRPPLKRKLRVRDSSGNPSSKGRKV